MPWVGLQSMRCGYRAARKLGGMPKASKAGCIPKEGSQASVEGLHSMPTRVMVALERGMQTPFTILQPRIVIHPGKA
jgi:hypothetical protein